MANFLHLSVEKCDVLLLSMTCCYFLIVRLNFRIIQDVLTKCTVKCTANILLAFFTSLNHANVKQISSSFYQKELGETLHL